MIENTFGIRKGRWRILNHVDVYTINKSVDIIKACCVLHNFCLLHLNDADNFTNTSEPIISPEVRDEGSNIKRNHICNELNV